MKKYFVAAIAVCLIASFVIIAEEVSSVNVVGYKKIDLPPSGKFIMLSVNFDAFEQTLLGVFGTNNLTKGKSAQADNIFIWDPSKGGVGGYWVYYQDANGDFRTYVGDILTNNAPVFTGQAMWIKSSPLSMQTNQITLMGEVVPLPNQTIPMVEGFQMLGYGFSSDVALSNTAFFASGATGGKAAQSDNMFIWDSNKGAAGGYHSLYLDGSGVWRDIVGDTEATNIIEMGKGFWYKAKAGSWTWVETNQYIGNL